MNHLWEKENALELSGRETCHMQDCESDLQHLPPPTQNTSKSLSVKSLRLLWEEKQYENQELE